MDDLVAVAPYTTDGDLFGPGGEGADMAARALAGLMDPAEVRLACRYLVEDLLGSGTLRR